MEGVDPLESREPDRERCERSAFLATERLARLTAVPFASRGSHSVRTAHRSSFEPSFAALTKTTFFEEPSRSERSERGTATRKKVEATVPIPVTVRGDQIRVLDSEER